MQIFSNHAGKISLLTKRTRTGVEYITVSHGKRSIVKSSADIFFASNTQIEGVPSTLARTWLKSNIKMTERVRKELEMVEEMQNEQEEVVEKPKRQKKEKVVKEKRETKFAFIPADSTFKTLGNDRKQSESIRSKVWECLNGFDGATAEEIADELGIDVKVALGNLRNLVHDNKAFVV